MASSTFWDEILVRKYPSFKIEIQAFLDSLDVASSTEVSTDFIYQRIRGSPVVNENLKLLYREAIYGTNKLVKLRIKNHITNFRRTLRYEVCTIFSITNTLIHLQLGTLMFYIFSEDIPKLSVWTWCMRLIFQTWAWVKWNEQSMTTEAVNKKLQLIFSKCIFRN